jgi:hypothetical protein
MKKGRKEEKKKGKYLFRRLCHEERKEIPF